MLIVDYDSFNLTLLFPKILDVLIFNNLIQRKYHTDFLSEIPIFFITIHDGEQLLHYLCRPLVSSLQIGYHVINLVKRPQIETAFQTLIW